MNITVIVFFRFLPAFTFHSTIPFYGLKEEPEFYPDSVHFVLTQLSQSFNTILYHFWMRHWPP